MENQKDLIVKELNKLNSVSFIPKPTASDLHSQRNHLVSRVQRKEDEQYKRKMMERKAFLEKQLTEVNSYSNKLRLEEERRSRVLSDWNREGLKKRDNGSMPMRPIFRPIDQVVRRPNVVLGKTPMLAKTRMMVRMQRGRM